MQTLQRGQKLKWESISPNSSLRLVAGLAARLPGSATLDYSCFGVDDQGRLSDDRYFIFYNQKASPCGSLSMRGATGDDAERFEVNLAKLPGTIRRLVFVITIDGAAEMRQLQTGHWRLQDPAGRILVDFPFRGADFGGEKALIVGELYFKDGGRVAATGQGFNGGLGALLKHFGGEEVSPADSPVPAPQPPASPPSLPVVPAKLDLAKKLEKDAPHLVSLVKPLKLSLEKRRLQDVVARVALVLDATGSMRQQYSKGCVQTIVDRILPLAIHFDDDGEFDTWAYALEQKALTPVSGKNVRDYVQLEWNGWKHWMKALSGRNNEPVVIREVIEHYRHSRLPAYVIFITDGGVAHAREIERLMVEASRLPSSGSSWASAARTMGYLNASTPCGDASSTTATFSRSMTSTVSVSRSFTNGCSESSRNGCGRHGI